MRTIRLLLAICLLAAPLFAENLVLVDATIIDGTGKVRAAGNVRIRDGKIADIGVFRPAAGESLIDVKGMIVAPGFIDLENRASGAVGITTGIEGSDGKGPYLIEEFMAPFDEKPPPMNIAMLVGHGTVRRQVMGEDFKRAAKADEIQRMAELVGTGMRQGAFGLASDLRTVPALFSSFDELIALAKAVNAFGGTFLVHPRDENIKEIVDVARNSKVVIQISLNKLTASVLGDLDRARMQGIDVGAHIYGFTETGRDLRALLQNPAAIISFDQYARDDKAITLERAIQKATSLPASRFALKERGTLRKGVPADIVVFNPLNLSGGMKYVFVNGTLIVKDGRPTDAHVGQALR
jgi:N-acyl-D-amino-acid deacylase